MNFKVPHQMQSEPIPVTHTQSLIQLAVVGVAAISYAFASPVLGGPSVVPDKRDGQVFEALLLHLLADTKFDMTRISTNGASIVLHSRTPEKTGFLMSSQMRSDIGDHTLPRDAERDLRSRNTPPDAKPDKYDAVTAFYTNLTFSAPVVVADLTDKWGGRRSNHGFQDAHPKARGWAQAYLPGYSIDGTYAVVRAALGPSPHGAMVTAVLKKRGNKWEVQWHHIAWYA